MRCYQTFLFLKLNCLLMILRVRVLYINAIVSFLPFTSIREFIYNMYSYRDIYPNSSLKRLDGVLRLEKKKMSLNCTSSSSI
jgi:hypothetical protein